MNDLRRENREQHVPVLLNEVLGYLVKPVATYVDGTLGDGGHAKSLLEASDEKSCLVGIDLDTEGLERARVSLAGYGSRVQIFHNTFANIVEVVKESGKENVMGILFDLGMSTHHLQVNRGFSFKNEGELDMRFDPTGQTILPDPKMPFLKKLARENSSFKARDLLNKLHKEELSEVFRVYGEEIFADRIAAEVVKTRRSGDFENVSEFVRVVVDAYPVSKRHGRTHVATKCFQALRIAVNREYETLEIAIKGALSVLSVGGRLAIISFHSGEDRIVKNMFRDISKSNNEYKILTKHPIKPLFEEVTKNAWSRSAKLRVIEKINKQK